MDQIISQYHGKRLIADDRLRAQHGMPQTQGLRLAQINALDVGRHDLAYCFKQCLLAARRQLGFHFERAIEVILNCPLAAAGDKDEFRDPGCHRLFHRILNQWLIHNRKHFLRTRLGCRQKPRTQTCHWKNRFSNHAHFFSDCPNKFSNPASSSMAMPSSTAFTCLLPGSAPQTTKSVFFDTLPVTLPPQSRIR